MAILARRLNATDTQRQQLALATFPKGQLSERKHVISCC